MLLVLDSTCTVLALLAKFCVLLMLDPLEESWLPGCSRGHRLHTEVGQAPFVDRVDPGKQEGRLAVQHKHLRPLSPGLSL